MIGMPHDSSAHGPTTIWITGDQCSPGNSALAGVDPARAVVLMIESTARARLVPYHKRKLVLIYAVMRHFAADLRAAGWTVDYRAEADDYPAELAAHVERFRPRALRFMEQSEFGRSDRYRAAVEALGVPVEITPHTGFLSTAAEFDRLAGTADKRVTMETFYRVMRRKTGILMDGSEPAGGAWNYDAENRERPRAGLRFADPPRFAPDAITQSAIDFVTRTFPDHPGTIGEFSLAVTRRDALVLLEHFVRERLDTFGPYQDAMVRGNREMSHSLLSAALNTGLLGPLEIVERAELAYRSGEARLASVEGFVRQIIGWREFVWRVYWKRMPEYRERNALGATVPLPAFYWSGDTDMACLAETLSAVRETAYAHHIQRLMILGNFALIAGLEPQAVNDWFWAMFIDGYDWVMVPNVIGMTLHADGGYVGTKPYAASAAYINRMSDYCRGCRYDRNDAAGADACPFNALYWDFVARNEARFAPNVRMRMIVRNWQGRPAPVQAAIRARAGEIVRRLRANERL
jgi:deoxyribodipyrimidine photolyase-related protein